MGRRLVAAGCALMLTLSGCGQFKIVYEPPEEAVAEEAPTLELDQGSKASLDPALLKEYPVEVELDGITFYVGEENKGWSAPEYESENGEHGVIVDYDTPGKEYDGNLGVVRLFKCNVSPQDKFNVPELGLGLPDTDYINAMDDYFDDLRSEHLDTVYNASNWEVKREPGGVVCSCLYSEYPDVTRADIAIYTINGECALIFTDHGSYLFESYFMVTDFGSEDLDDDWLMFHVLDTLWVGKDS